MFNERIRREVKKEKTREHIYTNEKGEHSSFLDQSLSSVILDFNHNREMSEFNGYEMVMNSLCGEK